MPSFLKENPVWSVFCEGPILEAIHDVHLYKDSKTFVDMKLKHDPDVVLAAFDKLTKRQKPNKEVMTAFMMQHFAPPDSETTPWTPTDWKEHIPLLSSIKDKNLKEWAAFLNNTWKTLGHKVKDEVKKSPNRYTILQHEQPFIVPGGRFREIYYWDSYYIIVGLVVCQMYDTIKGMIRNLAAFVERYGFIPNSGRVYALSRSQAPYFSPMVDAYYEATRDREFVQEMLPIMEKEHQFWINNRSVQVKMGEKCYTLQRYMSTLKSPRAESYGEDHETAAKYKGDRQTLCYSELGAACESGWDFSSRWFSRDPACNAQLSTIRTSQILPVDLNCLLFWTESLLAKYHLLVGNNSSHTKYSKMADERKAAIHDVFWDRNQGFWFDFDLDTQTTNPVFFPSGFYPLFVQAYGENDKEKEEQEGLILQYIEKIDLLKYHGVPNSLVDTGQQWDFPNAWPNIQHVVIMGLNKCVSKAGRDVGLTIAQKWVSLNYRAWRHTGYMYEKYDACTGLSPGHGGEYEVQVGFGWTNGVILDLLHTYGEALVADDKDDKDVE